MALVAALLALLLGTGYAPGAVRLTAVSRINMALVPVTLLWTLLVLQAGLRRQSAT